MSAAEEWLERHDKHNPRQSYAWITEGADVTHFRPFISNGRNFSLPDLMRVIGNPLEGDK